MSQRYYLLSSPSTTNNLLLSSLRRDLFLEVLITTMDSLTLSNLSDRVYEFSVFLLHFLSNASICELFDSQAYKSDAVSSFLLLK